MSTFFKALFKLINVAVIVALLAIHFVFKDKVFLSSLFFYTFPLPVIIAIILLLSIFLSKNFRRYNIVLTGILTLIWFSRSLKIHSAYKIKDSDLEIVFWNASHDRNFEDAFNVNNGIPDVLILVETHDNELKELKKKYPNYYFYLSEKEIGVFTKMPLNNLKEIPSKYGSTVISFELSGINFFAVDVSASMDVPREWELGFINSMVKSNKNSVVLGDFNVPYESIYLKKLKENFNHAFTKKGTGFRETWFWNLPLLSLDHIWVSKDLKILKAEKINTFKSDHSMVKAFIRN